MELRRGVTDFGLLGHGHQRGKDSVMVVFWDLGF